jgi:hypothetical protein
MSELIIQRVLDNQATLVLSTTSGVNMLKFYKNQAARCDAEVRNHEREADRYDALAADETMNGNSTSAQEYADIADAARSEAAMAQKESINYRNAVDNWN